MEFKFVAGIIDRATKFVEGTAITPVHSGYSKQVRIVTDPE